MRTSEPDVDTQHGRTLTELRDSETRTVKDGPLIVAERRQAFHRFRIAVSTGGAPEREVITDRPMETWYHPSIA